MFNHELFQKAFADYKANFNSDWWKLESYKWEAIKTFQDNFNLEVLNNDFSEMLKRSLAKTYNLLESGRYFPRLMLANRYASAEPDTVREMFRVLFDEDRNLNERIDYFQNRAKELSTRYPDYGKNDYQDLHAVTTYLWLRYPEKHYIYKYSLGNNMSKVLESEYVIKKNKDEQNIINFYSLYDEVRSEIQKDEDFKNKLCSFFTADCYKEENLNTVVVDFGFYLKRKWKNTENVPVVEPVVKSGTTRYWIYAPGEQARFWDEFYEKEIMAIGWEEIGDLRQYESKSAMKVAMIEKIDPNQSFVGSAFMTWNFVNKMSIGDVIFVKKGSKIIVGRGEVISDYFYDEKRNEYNNVRKVKWTHKGEWESPCGNLTRNTLTELTTYPESVAKLNELFDIEQDPQTPKSIYEAYSKDKFLNEVYISEEDYVKIKEILDRKKNIILQGAPGVGKTYAAKRLAYSIIGSRNDDRVAMVQFHQSYSYEDFIMGYRPTENGFELKNGVFYNFCKKAEQDDESNGYYFIIDEINRGNLSKIFGELFMLIENDKRGEKIQLVYNSEFFSIPENVYIIGLMNTADRSLAMIDYALRRRFAFFDMKPAFESEGFKKYKEDLDDEKFNNLIKCVENLNDFIKNDPSLGEGFCIGHSYFCNIDDIEDGVLSQIVDYEILPLLREYWYDEPRNVTEWTDKLNVAIQ